MLIRWVFWNGRCPWRIFLASVFLQFLESPSVQATAVFYHNTENISEDKRFEIEAKSPHNVKGNWSQPFADGFVNNAGWVVIGTGIDNLNFVDEKGGDISTINILKNVFSKEDSKFVGHTSAGPNVGKFILVVFPGGRSPKLFRDSSLVGAS